MIEVLEHDIDEDNVINMGDMKPLQVGIIVGNYHGYFGHYVMRTAAISSFEVMNLSNPREGGCWSSNTPDSSCDIKVRLLGEGESITIKLSNS
ncbi:hypothetical protein N9043_00645 [bacterium]|nr:hypothetical protein [bacterium]